MREEAIDAALVQLYMQAHERQPERIVLVLDATDDPLHRNQEGRFFHGYYGHYCYLPLYIFAGEHLLCAAAALQHRRRGGLGRGGETDCRDAAAGVAGGGDHPAR